MAQNEGRSPLSDLTAEESQQVLTVLVLTCKSAQEREQLFARPTEHAVCAGDAVLVENLLKLGASAKAQCSDGDRLLHMAAAAGSHGAVRALVRHGAAVHALDRNRHTALHLAAMNDNPRTVAALVCGGARANFRPSLYEESALDVAATFGSVAVIDTFRVHGADLRKGNWDGYTALHAAASEDQVGAIRSLIRGGANVNSVDGTRSTPLHVAMQKNNHESVRALCALGADMNKFDAKHNTPLHHGIKAPGSLSAVNALLDAGADANLRQADFENPSPLDMAAYMGKVDIVRALLMHGAVSTAVDSNGQSALHKASSCNAAAAVDALIEAGGLVNARDGIGRRPLHFAAYVLAAEAANALLAHGAEVNANDESEQTPLHLAARMSEENNAARLVELLLNSDADEAPVDTGGCTPGDLLVLQEEVDEYGQPQPPRNNALVLDQLSRAPEERTWRRQRVFAMHRARLKRARANLTDPDPAPRREKVARVEGNDAAGNVGGQGVAHRGAAEGASVADNDAECVMKKFVGVAEDGVFRNILKFL